MNQPVTPPRLDAFVINPSPESVFCKVCHQCPCCCGVRRNHKEGCKFRRAIELPIAIECDHGHDVCPTCDPCTCGAGLCAGDLS
jgi:hypothetical protein